MSIRQIRKKAKELGHDLGNFKSRYSAHIPPFVIRTLMYKVAYCNKCTCAVFSDEPMINKCRVK